MEGRARELVRDARFLQRMLPTAIFAVYVETGLVDPAIYNDIMGRTEGDATGPVQGDLRYPIWNMFLDYAQFYDQTQDLTDRSKLDELEKGAVKLVREILGQLHKLPKVTHRLDILNRLDQLFTR